MKKKVLLLEDRPDRMLSYLSDSEKFINHTALDILDPKEINNFILNIDSSEVYSKYNVILAHRSLFRESLDFSLKMILDYCKKTKSPLVLFSGGIGHITYEVQSYPYLVLNSKLFYSENLLFFLDKVEEGDFDLQMIAYGKHWSLAQKLKERHIASYSVDRNEEELRELTKSINETIIGI